MGKTLIYNLQSTIYNLQSCRMGRRYLVEIIEVAEEKPLGCGGVLMVVLALTIALVVNIWLGREEKKDSETTEQKVEQSSAVAPHVRTKVEYEPESKPKPARAILQDGVTGTGESVMPIKSSEVRPAVVSSAAPGTIPAPITLQRSVTASAEKEDDIGDAEPETDTVTNKARRKAERQAKRQAKREARLQNKMQEND